MLVTSALVTVSCRNLSASCRCPDNFTCVDSSAWNTGPNPGPPPPPPHHTTGHISFKFPNGLHWRYIIPETWKICYRCLSVIIQTRLKFTSTDEESRHPHHDSDEAFVPWDHYHNRIVLFDHDSYGLAALAANHYTTSLVRRPAIYTATQS